MTSGPTFIDECLAGECDLDAIDDYVDRWHEGGTGMELWRYLGMTWDEYALWVERGEALPAILHARRFGTQVDEALESMRLAARGATAEELQRLSEWLEQRKTAT